jgi:hypothetical protein
MDIDRRRACAMILTAAGIPGETRAQASDRRFDPIAFAKLRAGEIARAIEESPREASVPRPSWDAIFKTGLLLQAGLRALLPAPEREGVALPGTPSPDDPKELVIAQENYGAVFASGVEATPSQKAIAAGAVRSAAQQLENAGYRSLSGRVIDWLRIQERGP